MLVRNRVLFLVVCLTTPLSWSQNSISVSCGPCMDAPTQTIAAAVRERLPSIHLKTLPDPGWEVSVDSVIIPRSPDTLTHIALSVAVTKKGHLVDQWATSCTLEHVDTCTEGLPGRLSQVIANNPPVSAIRRPQTGENLIPTSGSLEGKGIVTLTCSTALDSIVRVVDEHGHEVRSVYVRGNDTLTISGLPPGIYSVKVAQGEHYAGNRRLDGDVKYFKFPHPYAFTETYTGTHVEYSHLSLTINPVPGGNVDATPITAAEFWQDAGL